MNTTSPSAPPACWLVPDAGCDPTAALEPLGTLSPAGRQVVRLRLFDTFEWSLWHAGLLLLARLGREACLELHVARRLGEAPPLASWPGRSEPPQRREDWPPGPMARKVARLVKLRAFRPVAALRIARRRLVLENEDAKSVVRVACESWSPLRGPAVLETWRVEPMRGYEVERAAVDRALGFAGLVPSPGSPVETALARIGVRPRRWSVRPRFDFGPATPSRIAATEMLRSALLLARATEAGICEDIDVEFLHDYRICIRKARSIVSQLKGVLPQAETARLRAELAEMGSATSLLRDLDVIMLERDRLEGMLPEEMRAGLQSLFVELTARRAAEQRRLGRVLRSAPYGERTRAMLTLLDRAPEWPRTDRGDQPAKEIADRLLWRAYRRVCRVGRALGPHTPDADVHRLRMDTKKLRYLLEHFSGIFDSRAIALLVKHLRRLQDTLGEFNDCSVQRRLLLDFVPDRNAAVRADLALSVGALAGVLHREQQVARERVRAQFEDFDRSSVRALAEGLFRCGDGSPRGTE